MMMQFHSLSQFLAMGGYAFYVWMAYGMFVVVTTGLVFTSYRHRRQVIAREIRRQRRDEVMHSQATGEMGGVGGRS